MMETLDAPEDVIALRISHKITGDMLDSIMDRLDRTMASHDKVHVFVETHAIDGIELAGLPSYIARALPLFGKLGRFGRVAVVADQHGFGRVRGSRARCCRSSATAPSSPPSEIRHTPG